MVSVDTLFALKGDVRKLLELSDNEVHWTDRTELGRLEVLSGLHFDRFSLSDAEIRLDFVSCEFSSCRFHNLRTDGHLWGARDVWRNCKFEDCGFKSMIAPMNSFVSCSFERATLQNFKPHQTLFTKSTFSNVVIEGLRAQTIRNRQMVNADIGAAPGQLVFRDCHFESMTFVQCYFDQVVFERCSFSKVVAQSCSFDGLISDTVWWSKQDIDPYTAFLSKVLELIRTKCGDESAAYKEFENYAIDYGSGRTASRDFSACLYNNRVPYAETQKIIKDLRKLVAEHPF